MPSNGYAMLLLITVPRGRPTGKPAVASREPIEVGATVEPAVRDDRPSGGIGRRISWKSRNPSESTADSHSARIPAGTNRMLAVSARICSACTTWGYARGSTATAVLVRGKVVGSVALDLFHRVNVHVPQTGDEIAASTVRDPCAVRHGDIVHRSDGRDAAAGYEHGLLGMERAIPNIDDRDARDGDGGKLRARAGTKKQAEDAGEVLRALTDRVAGSKKARRPEHRRKHGRFGCGVRPFLVKWRRHQLHRGRPTHGRRGTRNHLPPPGPPKAPPPPALPADHRARLRRTRPSCGRRRSHRR